MARDKGRVKLTFMVPSYLVELADMQAEAMPGLDRYDVIRMALGEGLMQLRINSELLNNPHAYAQELHALTSGEPGAHERLQKKVADNVFQLVKTAKQKRDEAA